MELRSTTVISSYKRLFSLGDRYDFAVMMLGSLGSVINGLALPAMYIIQSHVYNNYGKLRNGSSSTFFNANHQAVWCVYLAAVTLIGAYLEVSCWIYNGHRQAGRLRVTYVSCVLRQDSAYFDCKCSTAEVINSVSTDIVHVQEAVGEKLGQLIENVILFLGSFIASLYLTWRMTLIVLPFVLVLLLPGFMYSRALSKYANQRQKSYAAAGNIAEQAISSIRLVYSFVAEKRTCELFSRELKASNDVDRKQGLAKGLALGIHGLRYVVWSLMIWYGGILVVDGKANGAQILIAGSAFVVGSMALGNVIQNLKDVSDGHAALCRIFQVLDVTPSIDIESSEGKVLDDARGGLEFINVLFAYPSRPDVAVRFRSIAGKTTAIVGKSGSGKSTVVCLLERLYDPLDGEVLLDGRNIRYLQLKWYRQQIGLVSQEPILFSSTIKDNILLGNDDATMEEVIEAAKTADAHSFITSFPGGYNTQVGVRGTQLSGGQKQRIALARAMIRNPIILLLDEATSALDNESERTIQKAIQKVCSGRTAVVIAHKLQAIQSADFIAVVDGGQVVEYGTREELRKGAFAEMFLLQQTKTDQIQQKETVKIKSNGGVIQIQTGTVEGSHAEIQQKLSFTRLLLMNRPEWKYCMAGLAGAICVGFIHPLFVAIGADAVSSYYSADLTKVRNRIRIDAAIFAALSVASLLINTLQHYSFGAMGAALTRRVREKMLEKILELDISWFDQEQHSAGALTSRLASSASMVRTVVGDRMSLVVQTAATVSVSLIASFVLSWRLAIVITSIQPIVLVCFYLRVNNLQNFARKAARIQEEVSQLVLEGITQHQTVAAFSSQDKIVTFLRTRLLTLSKKTVNLSQTAGISSGVALFALFSSYGMCLWYGGRLIAEGKSSFKEFLVTFYLLIGTGRSLADTLALSPDISQGTTVAESVFKILDAKQTRSNTTTESDHKAAEIEGRIDFERVTFGYPSRPDILVLDDFSLTVDVAQTVAMVGRSGSGKSTVISLLERFYEPQLGGIKIDGRDIKQLQLEFLRQQIGLVSQEPTLFALTIRANIAYGKDNASDAEIVEAAQAANAHEFISSLPQGYSTFVGNIGVQLSGGQKQRIAIARAILKQPKILLLDEATSALDTNSESVVQHALDKVMKGKTTIVVAHRLSTIENADRIAVINDGKVAEQGSHNELLALGSDGAYYSLVHA